VITLRLTEGGEGQVAQLPSATVLSLIEGGVVRAVPHGGESWLLSDAGKVGVAQIDDVTVWVKPKMPIARLLFLLGFAHNPGWRANELAAYEEVSGLVPALAYAFATQTERALLPGLLHGYVPIDDSLAVLRGRLRLREQQERQFGLPLPLLVHYDDHVADIAENQLLSSATECLLWLPDIDGAVRTRLRRIQHSLAGVTRLVPGRTLPRWQVSRLNARYQDALWLAELVLSCNSVEHAPGTVRLSGFLVDMAKVFEDFVTAALTVALESRGGRCHPQDSRWRLDHGGRVHMKPDLVWDLDGQPVAVMDAKYKAERPSGFPDADIYQLLAYTTAIGLPEGHLIYAKGNEEPVAHRIRNTEITVHAHCLDLDTEPTTLLMEIDALAALIAASAPTGIAEVASA